MTVARSTHLFKKAMKRKYNYSEIGKNVVERRMVQMNR